MAMRASTDRNCNHIERLFRAEPVTDFALLYPVHPDILSNFGLCGSAVYRQDEQDLQDGIVEEICASAKLPAVPAAVTQIMEHCKFLWGFLNWPPSMGVEESLCS